MSLVHRAGMICVERLERAPKDLKVFVEHAAAQADRDLAGRGSTATELERVTQIVAERALSFVFRGSKLPARGALRDEGSRAGADAAREVVNRRGSR